MAVSGCAESAAVGMELDVHKDDHVAPPLVVISASGKFVWFGKVPEVE
jgi:hypothetical protein